jgi:16S rRNA (cytosine967-C5)-methyltransferase
MATVLSTTRLHELKSIVPIILDATEQLPFPRESFDRVLVDAPCSGTGTLRANPEIRWRLAEGDFENFAKQQKKILSRAIEVLKPGGRLVYSTCSVELEENEEVIKDLNLRLLRTLRTWPQHEGTDGFVMAVFQR